MSIQVNPFIWLDGQAREAIDFYLETLPAKLHFIQTFGEGPQQPGEAPMPETHKARIAHSVLQAGASEFYVADHLPDRPLPLGTGIQILLTVDTADEAQRLFGALGERGQVLMPLGPIHFSPAYGIVTDKFGVTFQVFTRRSR
ncbi:VOC family protein [Paenibacillus sp. NFR01]|uniref:VOC family protein n=1 Tax=Paenibacillus sp. NFR01 TaxID=1566279 RepID=UPI0008D7BCD4|nr:VOC family protein [Paenibacillus sp. NFR01]SEU23451.1 PhnB protein [Paenibacillus sp. NFR01]